MFSVVSMLSMVLIAAALGANAESHTVNFINKCVSFNYSLKIVDAG